MKYIFDFDGTLFNTDKLKEWRAKCFLDAGIGQKEHDLFIKKTVGDNNGLFSLKKLLDLVFEKKTITGISKNAMQKRIMSICPDILNNNLVKLARKSGRDNCFIASHGDKEFQIEKIQKSGIADLFTEIFITPDSKKGIVENICKKFSGEEVIFIDNKQKVFDDLDLKKCPNLRTVLYTGQNLESYFQ